MKIFLKSLLVIVLFFIVLVAGLFIRKKYKILQLNATDYYKNIATDKCSFVFFATPLDCCFDNINMMAEHGYVLPSQGMCPEGFKKEVSLCSGALSFCRPIKK